MAQEIVEEVIRKKEEEDREEFWLKRLILMLDRAIKDEGEAVWMYDKLRTEMAAMYPPGSPEYDTIKEIKGDEMRHMQELRRVLESVKKRLAGL